MRRWVLVFLLANLSLALSGCGKLGAPALPAGEKSTYPRTYPSGNNE